MTRVLGVTALRVYLSDLDKKRKKAEVPSSPRIRAGVRVSLKEQPYSASQSPSCFGARVRVDVRVQCYGLLF